MDKSRRHPELVRLYLAVGLLALIWLAFRIYRLLSSLTASPLDPTSRWTLLGAGIFNALLITILAFIVGRSLAKLWFDRRKGLLGARIRTKLVLALLAVGIVPSLLIYLIGKDFISQNIARWFRPDTQQLLQDGKTLAEGLKSQTLGQLHSRLSRYDPGMPGEAARQFLEVDLLRAPGEAGLLTLKPGLPPPPALQDGLQETPEGLWVLASRPDGAMAGLRLERQYGDALHRLERRIGEALLLGDNRETLQSPAENTLLLLTVLSIFAAVWTGLMLSKSISEPVQTLADAAHLVGLGDLEARVPEEGKDELAFLGRAFNRMTGDLKTSRTAIQAQADAIERQRAYLGQLLEALPVGVMSWDEAGQLRTFNPAARSWFGCTQEVLPNWQVLAEQPRFGDLPRLLSAARESLRPLQEEFRIGTEGEGRPVRTMVLPMDGGGLLAVLEDLSALANAEKRAAWQEVARRMAHEVKNPLTPIKLTAQRLLRRSKDGRMELATLGEAAETILTEVTSLQRLVDSFTQFAKLPSPVFRPLDAADLLRQVHALYAPNHAGITWDLSLPAEPVPVTWDGDMVKRIALNLVDNALGAMGGQGTLRLILDPSESHLSLRVENNGPEVPPELRARLFEPYFSTKSKGTGLGLAIVRRIAEDHGGSAHYEPLNPGSRFVVRLPRIAVPPGVPVDSSHGLESPTA